MIPEHVKKQLTNKCTDCDRKFVVGDHRTVWEGRGCFCDSCFSSRRINETIERNLKYSKPQPNKKN